MAVTKDAAFYRKQRERDKAAAAKGDPKAKKELAQIEAKRQGKGAPTKTYTVDGKTVRAISRAAALKQAGKSTSNGRPQSAMAQVGKAIATSTPGGKALGAVQSWKRGKDVQEAKTTRGALSTIGKVLSGSGPPTRGGYTGTYNPQPISQPAKKNGNGSIGTYSGSKPRAYSSLSPSDKAKEDRQNERDMGQSAKKSNGK